MNTSVLPVLRPYQLPLRAANLRDPWTCNRPASKEADLGTGHGDTGRDDGRTDV